MEKYKDINILVPQKLLKKIKEGYYLPYFTERAEEEFSSDSEFGSVEDLKDYMERIVIDFLECRIIEAEVG